MNLKQDFQILQVKIAGVHIVQTLLKNYVKIFKVVYLVKVKHSLHKKEVKTGLLKIKRNQ
jgi:hypothetical protein